MSGDAPNSILMSDLALDEWIRALEVRYLADLTFPEVSRALRALSSAYVERRSRLSRGAALSGLGKRAAFALFYGPLHYLLIRHIVRALPGAAAVRQAVIDLGCGTGASGAAWATSVAARPKVVGIDRHPWTVEEARRTYRHFGLDARVHLGDLRRADLPSSGSVLAAFTLNELDDRSREAVLPRFVTRRAGGGHVLVVEPLGRFVAPWWNRWRRVFEDAGGRADEWRVATELPAIVHKLDRSAGLNHREITGRSL